MIELIATAESMAQAEELLAVGVDTTSLYIGEEVVFGLRLPTQSKLFLVKNKRALIDLAHANGKKVNVAINGIMHPDKMKKIPCIFSSRFFFFPEYLAFWQM